MTSLENMLGTNVYINVPGAVCDISNFSYTYAAYKSMTRKSKILEDKTQELEKVKDIIEYAIKQYEEINDIEKKLRYIFWTYAFESETLKDKINFSLSKINEDGLSALEEIFKIYFVKEITEEFIKKVMSGREYSANDLKDEYLSYISTILSSNIPIDSKYNFAKIEDITIEFSNNLPKICFGL